LGQRHISVKWFMGFGIAGDEIHSFVSDFRVYLASGFQIIFFHDCHFAPFFSLQHHLPEATSSSNTTGEPIRATTEPICATAGKTVCASPSKPVGSGRTPAGE